MGKSDWLKFSQKSGVLPDSVCDDGIRSYSTFRCVESEGKRFSYMLVLSCGMRWLQASGDVQYEAIGTQTC